MQPKLDANQYPIYEYFEAFDHKFDHKNCQLAHLPQENRLFGFIFTEDSHHNLTEISAIFVFEYTLPLLRAVRKNETGITAPYTFYILAI